MPEKYFVKVMKEIESLIKYDIEIVLFCDHISSFIQSSLSSSKALKMEDWNKSYLESFTFRCLTNIITIRGRDYFGNDNVMLNSL